MHHLSALIIVALFLQFGQCIWVEKMNVPWLPNYPVKAVDLCATYNGFLYISDDTNRAVYVMDIATLSFQTPISALSGTDGPNGLAVVTSTHEIWAGNGNSTVTIINAISNSVVGGVDSNGTGDADELCFDPVHNLVALTNPDDKPPFLSFIDVASRKVLGSLTFTNSSALEQCVFNPIDGHIYLSIPSDKNYGGGVVAVIDPTTYKLIKYIAEDECASRGAVFANDGVTLFLGCGEFADLHFFHNAVLNVATGAQTFVEGVGDSDQVSYISSSNTFITVGATDSGHFDLAFVQNGQYNQTIHVQDIVTISGFAVHSLAYDDPSGFVFVPMESGVAVYYFNASITSSAGVLVGSVGFVAGILAAWLTVLY